MFQNNIKEINSTLQPKYVYVSTAISEIRHYQQKDEISFIKELLG